MSKRWMISYDISEDKTRRMAYAVLKDYGERVQFSVFECDLTKAEFIRLRALLTEIIADDDSLRWYPLCQWCKAEISYQGTGTAKQADEYFLL